ncbi:MAG: polyamine aminopropyltransferase [Candidatus Methanospirareceae archaeon]
MVVVGRHVIAEFYGCAEEILDDVEKIKRALLRAAEEAGGTVKTSSFFKFQPQGVTGVVIIAESHLSIHTWPELQYAAIDIFTCGSKTDPRKGYLVLVQELKPKIVKVRDMERGPDYDLKEGRGEDEEDEKEDAPVAMTVEVVSPHTIRFSEIKDVICSKESKYQNILIADTYDFGKCLILDGFIQSSTIDEWRYHESLVHPPMLTHPMPRKVLIIGGGEGATAREVLRHNTVEEVVMVELDEDVINLAKEHLKDMHKGAFDDERLKIVIEEGRSFLNKQPDEAYDVIILDVTDPFSESPSRYLFTKEFYELVKRKLSADGVFVTQATSTFFTREHCVSIYRTVKQVFPIAYLYQTYVPSYERVWGFAMGSKKYKVPEAEEVEEELRRRGVDGLKFYDSKAHILLFTLPKDVAEGLKKEGRILTDKEPSNLLYC